MLIVYNYLKNWSTDNFDYTLQQEFNCESIVGLKLYEYI